MACPHSDWLSNEEYSLQLHQKLAGNRVPVSGSIDLTYQCNFKCIHCYVKHRDQESTTRSRYLTTDQWKTIIDEITNRGCMFLLITGGDPFLREDFCEIYLYAKRKGLFITLFTNGYNVSEEIFKTLEKFPPRLIEITLYGATDETYHTITGKKNGFARCLENITRFKELEINVALKTVLLMLNYDEFNDIEKIADSFGMKFRYDPAIFPKFNGDRSPLELRVSPEKVVQLDFNKKQRAEAWQKHFQRFKNVRVDNKMYNCGTGKTTFHITAEGTLQPCLMATHISCELTDHSFSYGWDNVIPQIREIVPSQDNSCWNCERAMLCNYCPPFSAIEGGNENRRSEYLCNLSKLRLQEITAIT